MASNRLVSVATATLGLLLVAFAGCAKQSEGARCDQEVAGDTDCDTGLQCVPSDQLATGDDTDRCCPPESEGYSDKRCARKGTVSPTGTGGAGSEASAGAGGEATGGAGTLGTGGAGGAGG